MNPTPIILELQDLPEQVKAWDRHPKMLWCIGDISLLQLPLVSVIGSRDASPEGIARTRRITQLLVSGGAGVVSGLAEGIDAAAHMEALRCGGKTIAVMGTPIDECYPAKHLDLKEQIVRHGLVLSQFQPGKPVFRGNFPQRNELMAALCFITLVAEAGPTSGTRHQIACALKLGRRVGFLASLTAKGIPWVEEALATSHAFVVNQPEDVFKELRNFIPEIPLSITNLESIKGNEDGPIEPLSQLEFPVEIAERKNVQIDPILPETLEPTSAPPKSEPSFPTLLPVKEQEVVVENGTKKAGLIVSFGRTIWKWFSGRFR